MNVQPDINDLFPPDEKTMNEVVPFYFEGARVRTVNIDGELHFVGIDVCELLGYSNPSKAMSDHCRGITRRYPIVDALGRIQKARVLSEPDVLRLIVGCQLPTAQRFERWVFEEVLPAIRKTGSYSLPSAQQYPSLTTEDRSVIGGIVKRVSAAQIRPLAQMQQVDHSHLLALNQNVLALAQEIATLKTAPVPVTVEGEVCREYWPMTKILKSRGIGQKRRGRLVHRCTASMKTWCIKTGRPEAWKIVPGENGEDRCVFETAAAEDWLKDLGWAIIVDHKANLLDEPEEP